MTPTAGATISGTLTVAANATDNMGVVGVQFKLDGVNLGAEVTAAPYAASWNTTTAVNGPHTLTAVARDVAGNLGPAAPVSVTIANGTTLNTGLVGYWKFDEGTGLTAIDASGSGNTATLMNGPTWTTGKLNFALAFDGLTNYVTVPSTAALNAYPLTAAVWIKTNATSGVNGIVNKYVANSFNGYQVFMNNGNLCAWYLRDLSSSVYGGSGCPFNLPGYNDNQWHHVAFVVDASGGKLYVDGFLKGSLPWAGTPGAPTTSQPLHLAHYPQGASSGEYLPGVLDDVRIYNRALSPTEVSELYAATASTFAFTDDPLIPQSIVIKAAHITELRSAIASLRALSTLAPFTWTDPTLTPGTTPFRTLHVLELRTALNQVYQSLGRAVPTYTDPTIVAGQMVRAVHIAELRAAVQALQ